MTKKKKLNLPRAPLMRQTGGAHKADKGGRHDRRRSREETRREIKEDQG